MSGLSLWNIEQGLADLMEQREELLSNPPPFGASADDPEETYDRQLMAVDLAIAAYMKAEVQKVDGVRGWWKYLEMMRDAAKDEARTMQDRAQAFDRQLTVLKSAILVTLEEMEFRAGKPRKLEGKTGSISLVGNGGRRPVVIIDEALIPDEYLKVTVTMSLAEWRYICKSAAVTAVECVESRKEPNLTAIYNALEKPCTTCGGEGMMTCDQCGGVGSFEVAHHDQNGNYQGSETVECHKGMPCTSCGCSGKQGVPGAVLAPLGSHVRVK